MKVLLFFCFLVLIERFVLLVHEVSLNKISAIPLVSFLLVLRIKLSSTCYHDIDFTVTSWLVHYLISRLLICKTFTGQYHIHPYERKCWIYDYGPDSVFKWTWNFKLRHSLLTSWIILMLFSSLRSYWWHKFVCYGFLTLSFPAGDFNRLLDYEVDTYRKSFYLLIGQ